MTLEELDRMLATELRRNGNQKRSAAREVQRRILQRGHETVVSLFRRLAVDALIHRINHVYDGGRGLVNPASGNGRAPSGEAPEFNGREARMQIQGGPLAYKVSIAGSFVTVGQVRGSELLRQVRIWERTRDTYARKAKFGRKVAEKTLAVGTDAVIADAWDELTKKEREFVCEWAGAPEELAKPAA